MVKGSIFLAGTVDTYRRSKLVRVSCLRRVNPIGPTNSSFFDADRYSLLNLSFTRRVDSPVPRGFTCSVIKDETKVHLRQIRRIMLAESREVSPERVRAIKGERSPSVSRATFLSTIEEKTEIKRENERKDEQGAAKN
ncbi:uncharacterized protein LOC112589108 [Harpegnathos saltator]|uniref:uncharacterized protein LOC112589108 n=1 Tax=Harpegnathos saltator TaxID=610380 RepID=UPI000DBED33C|nr:uncharacterized protein LOC112589108 [Harpegnathos saltator]